MPFVSITRLRVRSWRYVPGFLIQSIRSALQAKRAAWSLSVSVLRDADRAFWTVPSGGTTSRQAHLCDGADQRLPREAGDRSDRAEPVDPIARRLSRLAARAEGWSAQRATPSNQILRKTGNHEPGGIADQGLIQCGCSLRRPFFSL
jgi:hypothetical protein